MQLNQNYPWYMQRSVGFSSLYEGLFSVVSNASPLDVYKAMYPNFVEGGALLALANMWNITGDPRFTDALIYDMDNWSENKVWTGGVGSVDATIFRRFIEAKMYIQGKQICLATLKEIFDKIFENEGVTVTVSETPMAFDIHLAGNNEVIRTFIQIKSLDPAFLGAVPGIHCSYSYETQE